MQVVSLRYGVMFKKAFSQPFVFKAFVKDILGLDLEIEQVETEKQFLPPIGYVAARFDLFAEDKKKRVVVEIQHVRNPDHYDRFLYYHCIAMLEQISRFDSYRPNLAVYTIVVLTSGDKHKQDVVTIDFDPKTKDGKGLGEIRHKVIYLCPKYLNANTPEPYREWLKAINDTLDGEVEENAYTQDAIRRIFETIEKDLVSPAEHARMIDENQLQVQFESGKEIGLGDGLDEGRQIGLAEGRQVGLEEGRQSGLEEGRREAARRMLAKGMEAESVAEIMGFTLAEIQALG